jgi:hypothetical protein
MDDPEVDDGEHRELGVRHVGERGANGGSSTGRAAARDAPARRRGDADLGARLAHHVAPGRTGGPIVNSPAATERLAMVEPARARVAARRRHRQVERREDRCDRRTPAGLELGHRRPEDPGLDQTASPASGLNTVAASGRARRGAAAARRAARRRAASARTTAGVHPVVALLALELADELGERRPRPPASASSRTASAVSYR